MPTIPARFCEIFVDADACPVKAELERIADRHEILTHFVSNRGFRSHGHSFIRNVVVSDAFDAADDWIIAAILPGDIVITADIQLADRCLKSAAHVLGPSGRPFTKDNIGTALAMRELSHQLRDMGEIKGGNASFGAADRARFLDSLEKLIQKAKRA